MQYHQDDMFAMHWSNICVYAFVYSIGDQMPLRTAKAFISDMSIHLSAREPKQKAAGGRFFCQQWDGCYFSFTTRWTIRKLAKERPEEGSDLLLCSVYVANKIHAGSNKQKVLPPNLIDCALLTKEVCLSHDYQS